jgi:glutaredoxin
MAITIYGKPNCKTCDGAKQKLARLGIPYTFVDVSEPDSWRDDRRVDFQVERVWREDNGKPELPLIMIDGKWYDYPEAMARVRKREEAQE